MPHSSSIEKIEEIRKRIKCSHDRIEYPNFQRHRHFVESRRYDHGWSLAEERHLFRARDIVQTEFFAKCTKWSRPNLSSHHSSSAGILRSLGNIRISGEGGGERERERKLERNGIKDPHLGRVLSLIVLLCRSFIPRSKGFTR